MSDNQRRVLCRLIFLLVCVLPTSITSYWICHPQTADDWALAIQAKTGLEASIDFVETPSPYETVLHNLRLTDPEYGTLFETVQVRIRFDKQVEVDVPYKVRHVNNHGLARLLKTINQNVVSRGVDKSWRLRFAQPLEISKGNTAVGLSGPQTVSRNSLMAMLQNSFTVEDLNLDVVPTFDGTIVGANFELPQPNRFQSAENARSRDRVEVRLTKDPQGQEIWVSTLGQTLPCWLAADFIGDYTEGLGSDADFTGELRVQTHLASGQNKVRLHGILSRLSLSSYPLNVAINEKTRIQVTLNDCQFVNGEATNWSAMLDLPDLGIRSQISKLNLFQDSRRFAVGNAFDTAIIDAVTTRVASEPSRSPIGTRRF